MAKQKLAFFKWYPADADSDEEFRSMTDMELGFYIRCLNHAWMNKGLPADPNERARTLRNSRPYADRMWKRVGGRFTEVGGRMVNPRQEEERSAAEMKSRRATDSVRTRYERSENVAIRASDSDSVVVLGLDSKKKEIVPLRGIVSQKFREFWERWIALTGRRQKESYACQAFVSVVEAETELDCLACLERYGLSDEVRQGVVMNPDKWIYDQARDGFRGEWQLRKNGTATGIVAETARYLDEHPD